MGTTMVMGMLAWSGEVDAGQETMDRFRGLAEPIADMVRVMPYPEMYPREEEEYSPTGVVLTGFTDSLDGEMISTILDQIEASDAPMRVVQLRALGGAMAAIPIDATAFAHRDRRMMVNVAPSTRARRTGPGVRPGCRTWVRG